MQEEMVYSTMENQFYQIFANQAANQTNTNTNTQRPPTPPRNAQTQPTQSTQSTQPQPQNTTTPAPPTQQTQQQTQQQQQQQQQQRTPPNQFQFEIPTDPSQMAQHNLQFLPFVLLLVRRQHVIEDALTQLLMYRPRDFRKPLKVMFAGEEGIDEGGVQREFYDILTRELFDERYGMFKFVQETGTYWFNEHSFESAEQFYLIGLLCGLAIYNGIILNVRFAPVLYKKLCGKKTGLQDLTTSFPAIGQQITKGISLFLISLF